MVKIINLSFKEIKKNPYLMFNLFLSIVFISASVYRIFNFNAGIIEFDRFGFLTEYSAFFVFFIITLELFIAVFMLLERYQKYSLKAGLVFLSVPILISFVKFPQESFSNLDVLFTFKIEPTSLLLHIMYMLIMFVMLLNINKTK